MSSMEDIQDISDIGPALRVLRLKRGLTQRRLSELADLSRTRLSVIEKGAAQNIEVATLLRLLGALGARMTFELGTRPNLLQILRQRHLESQDAGPEPDATP
jgi:transcriptional regulator with XRE-family HTH domain